MNSSFDIMEIDFTLKYCSTKYPAIIVSLLFITFFFPYALVAQELYPVNIDGKYGYIDRKGKIVIKPSWQFGYPFHEGRAMIVNNGLYGFIDETGKVVVEPVYFFAHEFSDGRASVEIVEGDAGFIDRQGKKISSEKYIEARPFSKSSGLAAVKFEQGFGYVDKSFEVIIQPAYVNTGVFSEGRGRVVLKSGDGYKTGYVDEKGEWVVNAEYDEGRDFSNGLAAIRKGKLWGYVDLYGNVVIPIVYKKALSFSELEGLAVVQDEDSGNFGFIDKKGSYKIKPQYREAGSFSEGLAYVKMIEGKLVRKGYINVSGKVEFYTEEVHHEGVFDNGIAKMYLDSRRINPVYYTKMGKPIWEPDELAKAGSEPWPGGGPQVVATWVLPSTSERDVKIVAATNTKSGSDHSSPPNTSKNIEKTYYTGGIRSKQGEQKDVNNKPQEDNTGQSSSPETSIKKESKYYTGGIRPIKKDEEDIVKSNSGVSYSSARRIVLPVKSKSTGLSNLNGEPSEAILPPGHNKHGNYPVLVGYPPTTMTGWSSIGAVLVTDKYGQREEEAFEEVLMTHFKNYEEGKGFIVLVPPGRGSTREHSSTGFSAAIKRYHNRLNSDLKELAVNYGADTTKVVFAGYSLGGDLSWAMSLKNPENTLGAIVQGSRAGYRQKGSAEILAQRGARFYFAMGQFESEVRMKGVGYSKQLLDKNRISYKYYEIPGGGHVSMGKNNFLRALKFVMYKED